MQKTPEDSPSAASAGAIAQVVQSMTACIARQDFGAGIALYERTIDRFPRHLGLRLAHLRCILGRDGPGQAMVALERVRHECADAPALWMIHADILVAAGEQDAARAVLEEGCERFASAPGLWQKRARLLLQADDAEGALATVDQAKALGAPAPACEGLAIDALSRLARVDEALARFESVKADAPDPEGMLRRLASSAAGCPQPEQALDAVDAILADGGALASLNFMSNLASRLTAAGRRDLSDAVYDRLTHHLRARMPSDPGVLLDGLWADIEQEQIPAPAMDYAWRLSDRTQAERASWEREARWSHRSFWAMYHWDFITPREERRARLAGLVDGFDCRRFEAMRSATRGCLIVTAHLSTMNLVFAALSACNLPLRLLARREAHAFAQASRVLSLSAGTFGATRGALDALRRGELVALLPDGRKGMKRDVHRFDGREISVAELVPRLAYDDGIPSLWAGGLWVGDRVQCELDILPTPDGDEPYPAFKARWYDAYFGKIVAAVRQSPRNIGFEGTFWDGV